MSVTHTMYGVLRAVAAAAAVCLFTTGTLAQHDLTPFDATFKVSMKGLKGEMGMSLSHADDGFQALSRIKAKGLARLFAGGSVTETSDFMLSEGRVTPLRFESNDSLSGKTESSNMTFDWSVAQAVGSDEDGEFSHPIDTSTYDRVSIQYAFMLDLLNGHGNRDYTMLDGHRLKELDVRVLGESTIRVPYGEFTVIGIQHQRKNSSRMTTLWCARELGYVPVRIEQFRKGKRILLAEMSDYST